MSPTSKPAVTSGEVYINEHVRNSLGGIKAMIESSDPLDETALGQALCVLTAHLITETDVGTERNIDIVSGVSKILRGEQASGQAENSVGFFRDEFSSLREAHSRWKSGETDGIAQTIRLFDANDNLSLEIVAHPDKTEGLKIALRVHREASEPRYRKVVERFENAWKKLT